jgi:hypothetical protein
MNNPKTFPIALLVLVLSFNTATAILFVKLNLLNEKLWAIQ